MRKSICTICDPTTQCGLDCYVGEGRVIKVEGSQENPHNAGTLCSKGAASASGCTTRTGCAPRSRGWAPGAAARWCPSPGTRPSTPSPRTCSGQGRERPGSVVFFCGYPKHPRPFLQRLAMLYRLAQLLHGVERLQHGRRHGLALHLRAGGRPGPGEHALSVGLGREPLPRQHSVSPGTLDARDRGDEVHRRRPPGRPLASIADIHLQLRPGHRRSPGSRHGELHHLRGSVRSRVRVAMDPGFDEFRAYAADFTPERAEG